MAKYFGLSERDTLKTWTVLESVLSVAGFVVAAALSDYWTSSAAPVGGGNVTVAEGDPYSPWGRGDAFRMGVSNGS